MGKMYIIIITKGGKNVVITILSKMNENKKGKYASFEIIIFDLECYACNLT